jgi:primosomal protein N'
MVSALPRSAFTQQPQRLFIDEQEADMQVQFHAAVLSSIRAFAAPACCPHCGDWMVAPICSEFVEDGEIRHHWHCESCGEPSSTVIRLNGP